MEPEKLTIREIARLCHTSVSTVSRAINDQYDINPNTKKKIEEVIRAYGYVPNNSARNLKRIDSRNVAVLVKGITNPFFTGMLKVFEEICSEEDYSLVLQQVGEKQDEAELAAQLEKEKKLSGILFLGGAPYRSKEWLSRLSAPFMFCSVALREKKEVVPYPYVTIDDREESRKLVEYLIQQGHRRIAILCASEQDDSIGALRLSGYLDALKKHQISVEKELLRHPRSAADTYTHANGYYGVEKLLKEKVKFDAIYAISDWMAVGALRALRDHRINLPEEIGLVGFDGLTTGQFLVPSLTTLEQPAEAMAREAIQSLIRLMRGEEGECHQIFSGTLRKRESA